MTLEVAVIGIDGSGKSTLARALPMALAAECGVVAGAAGAEFWVFGPDQDHMAPGFHPKGLPHAARLARACRRIAKRLAGKPGLYPYAKLANLMFQDDAALAVARRYGCDVMVSDCNLVLSAIGRGSNYSRGATRGGVPRPRSRVEDLVALLAFLIEGDPLPEESAQRLPDLDAAGRVAKLARVLGFDGVWLPDLVLFLDVDPPVALERIGARGGMHDRHENLEDMTRARETYLKAMRALQLYRGSSCVRVIDANEAEPREVLARAIEALRPRIQSGRFASSGEVLGTPAGKTVRRVASPGYLFGYMVPKFFAGAWREPLFVLSAMGRRLLREGYSAGVMREIYDHDSASAGVFERAFLEYPLHRAVRDRLGILESAMEPELTWRLEQHARVRILTAPSGFCYDVLRPLESIAASRPELMRRVELVAADLDPHGELAPELERRAAALGISLHLVVGDLTAAETRRRLADFGPFDVALFVGLSSWLPRTEAAPHLRWLAANLRRDGLLVSDCFSAAAYSLGGRRLGYRAHYYSPEVYRSLLDHCGFDGRAIEVESGRDRINHVLIAEPVGSMSAATGSDPASGVEARRRDTAVRPTIAAAPASTADPMNRLAGPNTL